MKKWNTYLEMLGSFTNIEAVALFENSQNICKIISANDNCYYKYKVFCDKQHKCKFEKSDGNDNQSVINMKKRCFISHLNNIYKFEFQNNFKVYEQQGRVLTLFLLSDSKIDLDDNSKELLNLIIEKISKDAWENYSHIAILDSSAYFKALFETSNVGVSFGNINGEIILCNNAFVKMIGYDINEIIGKPFSVFSATEGLSVEYTLLSKLKNDEINYYRIRKQYICKNRQKIWVDLNVSKIQLKNSDEIIYAGVVINIDNQVNVENILSEREELFRTVANYTFDWEYWRAPDMSIKYISPSVERVTGYNKSEFIENPHLIRDIIISEDLKTFDEHEDREEDVQEIEFRIRHKLGGFRWIGHICYSIYDQNGNYRGRRVSNRDITAQKLLTLDLKESERRFSLLADNIGEVFFLYDKNGKVILTNKTYETIFGYPMHMAYGISLFGNSHIHPDDRKGLGDVFLELKKLKKNSVVVEFRIIRPDNEVRLLRASSKSIINDKNEFDGITVVCTDVTEFKETARREKLKEEQLRQADKMASLGILVSGVAHEINNPNNLIMLNSDFLQRMWKDLVPVIEEKAENDPEFKLNKLPYAIVKEEVVGLVEGISAGADRIRNIVHSLKEFVRSDSGRLDQKVALNNVVADSLMIVSNIVKKSTRHLGLNLAESLPLIQGNVQQIEQVIINLITNACDSLESVTKRVDISTFYDDNSVHLLIVDEGCGMSEDTKNSIMDPFFTTKRDRGGTGLGLSVSFQIIEAHNGILKFESEEGKGTSTELIFPILVDLGEVFAE